MPASHTSESSFKNEIDLDETIHIFAGGGGRVK